VGAERREAGSGSGSDALTLAADKITKFVQTVPPYAPHSHQPATCLHGRDG